MSFIEQLSFDEAGLYRKYKPFAENIQKLALRLADLPLSISIDGAWGVGKTTFIDRCWKKQLQDAGYTAIYFNSWEHDFTQEPLIPIYLELIKPFIGKGNFTEKSGGFVKTLASFISLTANKTINKAMDKYGIATPEEIDEHTKSYYQKILDIYNTESNLISEFKNSCREIVEIANKKPIFFFIDELDRCKPSFSIKVLESIKHFLSVKGIVFVFGIHKAELANSIKSIYSNDFNSLEYLERFVDYEFRLPIPTGKELAEQLFYRADIAFNKLLINTVFFEFRDQHFTKALEIREETRIEKNRKLLYERLIGFIGGFLSYYNVSFRKAEKALKKIKLIFILVDTQDDNKFNKDDYVYLITILCLFHTFDIKSYRLIINKVSNDQRMSNILDGILKHIHPDLHKAFNDRLFLIKPYDEIKSFIKMYKDKATNIHDDKYKTIELFEMHFGRVFKTFSNYTDNGYQFPNEINDIGLEISNAIDLVNEIST